MVCVAILSGPRVRVCVSALHAAYAYAQDLEMDSPEESGPIRVQPTRPVTAPSPQQPEKQPAVQAQSDASVECSSPASTVASGTAVFNSRVWREWIFRLGRNLWFEQISRFYGLTRKHQGARR